MKKILFTVLSLAISTALLAQDETETIRYTPDYNGMLQFHTKLSFPQGDFANTYSESAFFGIGGGLLFPIKESPIDAGLTVDYFWMERQTETQRLKDKFTGTYEVKSTINGNVVPVHSVLRVTPLRTINSPVQPYIQGMAGFRVFSIRTKIEVDDLSGGAQPDPDIEREPSAAWSYGYGGGVFVQIAENLNIDLSVSNLFGTNATYIDPESLEFDANGDPTYEKRESETHVANVRLGINIVF